MHFRMSSTTEWLVCGLCGAKVRQLFNNPAHRKLVARLVVQEVENIPSRFIMSQMTGLANCLLFQVVSVLHC